jgi:glutathionyl-hydroquinone reductase
MDKFPVLPVAISNHCVRSWSLYKYNMSEKKGITDWSNKDGHFKRQSSSFRDHITEGGEFAPEKGEER